MAKLEISNYGSIRSDAALTKLNSDMALIEAALENTLSRDGTSPNTMSASLDMNANQIINLPAATVNGQAIRYNEFAPIVAAIDAIDEAVEDAEASAISAA